MTLIQPLRRAQNYLKNGGLGAFLLKAVAGSGALQLVAMCLAFLVGVQLARGLGVEGYGQYGIAMAVITIASVPAELGLPRLVTREVAAAGALGDTATIFGILRWSDATCLLMSAVTAAIVAAGTLLVYGTPSSPVAAAILFGLPIIPLAALARIRGATLQGLHHVVLGQMPPILVRPLLLALLLLLLFQLHPQAGPALPMALNSVTAAVAFVLGAWLLRPRLPSRPSGEAAASSKGWLGSALALGATHGAFILQGQLAVVVLALVASDAEVGLFRIGLSTITIVALPIALITTVTSPLVSSLFSSDDNVRLQKLATSSARAQFAGVLLLSLPLLLAGEAFLGFVFGAKYEASADALRILCLGQVFSAAFGLNATLLNMTGNERRLTRALVIGLVANVATIAVLGSALGAVAGAWAYAASLAAWNVIAWADARRIVGINTLLR